MDSKEAAKIAHAQSRGISPETAMGDYYHHVTWESYKASSRNKLGGAVVGLGIGAGIGFATAGITALATGGLAFPVSAIIAGCAGAGTLFGIHEFSDIGKVAGGVAGGHEVQEKRLKKFLGDKFAALEAKIDALRGGKPASSLSVPPSVSEDTEPHSHCDNHCQPTEKWIFWKVALVGLAAGAAIGALLAAGGLVEGFLHLLGRAAEPLSHGIGEYAASMTACGLFGATYGLNRDLFRRVFDVTDRLSMGIFPDEDVAQGKAPAITPQRAPAPVRQPILQPDTKRAQTLVAPAAIDYPASDTYHQDKLRLALLNLDHTRLPPN